ncbi:Keratinocyte proline-rich protein, partial [Clarias magur]
RGQVGFHLRGMLSRHKGLSQGLTVLQEEQPAELQFLQILAPCLIQSLAPVSLVLSGLVQSLALSRPVSSPCVPGPVWSRPVSSLVPSSL